MHGEETIDYYIIRYVCSKHDGARKVHLWTSYLLYVGDENPSRLLSKSRDHFNLHIT